MTKHKDRAIQMKQMRDEGMTLQEIGDKYGITRERVRQLVKRRYKSTKMIHFYSRAQVAEILKCSYPKLVKLEKEGKLSPLIKKTYYLYDRRELEKAYQLTRPTPAVKIKKICEFCGKERLIPISAVRVISPFRFCSRKCLYASKAPKVKK